MVSLMLYTKLLRWMASNGANPVEEILRTCCVRSIFISIESRFVSSTIRIVMADFLKEEHRGHRSISYRLKSGLRQS